MNAKKLLYNPFIRVNEERVDLSAQSLLRGRLELDEGACTEQCDGCSEDIMQSGGLSRDHRFVVCDCGSKYEIIESLR